MKRKWEKNSLEEIAIVSAISSLLATTLVIVPAIITVMGSSTTLLKILILNVILIPIITANVFTYSVVTVKKEEIEVLNTFTDCLHKELKILWIAVIPLLMAKVVVTIFILIILLFVIFIILFPLRFTATIIREFNVFKNN